MTLSEFKTWFEGYTETIQAPPTEEQWERVKARINEISGSSPSYPMFYAREIYTPLRPYAPEEMGFGPCRLLLE